MPRLRVRISSQNERLMNDKNNITFDDGLYCSTVRNKDVTVRENNTWEKYSLLYSLSIQRVILPGKHFTTQQCNNIVLCFYHTNYVFPFAPTNSRQLRNTDYILFKISKFFVTEMHGKYYPFSTYISLAAPI